MWKTELILGIALAVPLLHTLARLVQPERGRVPRTAVRPRVRALHQFLRHRAHSLERRCRAVARADRHADGMDGSRRAHALRVGVTSFECIRRGREGRVTTGSMATDISLDSKVQAMSLKKYTISGFKMTTHQPTPSKRSLSSENVRVEGIMSDSATMTSAKREQAEAQGEPPFENMVWIPGGTFLMGSDDHYPEEAPAHEVTVDGFWMDRHTVTNEEFRTLRRGDRTRNVC